MSNRACSILQPCLNNGTCHNINSTLGYNCSCVTGFNGEICQSDDRVCRPDSCWNDGISRETERNERSDSISFVVGTCIQISNTAFQCQCAPGWEDEICQTMINYCSDDICLNAGVCQSSLLSYSCLCLAGSYAGRTCEVAEKRLVTLQMVSRSFAYVAIIAIVGVAIVVVVLDILKYCFGIDPVHRKRQKKKSRQRKKRKKPVQIIRFKYIHAPSQNVDRTIQDTNV